MCFCKEVCNNSNMLTSAIAIGSVALRDSAAAESRSAKDPRAMAGSKK